MTHIIAAAVRFNGVTHSMPKPHRHSDIIFRLHNGVAKYVKPSDQGFLTNEGLFVSRETGKKIATAAGQCVQDERRELYSEDLW